MTTLIKIIIICLLIPSCATLNKKYLAKNQVIFKVSTESLTTSKVEAFSSDKKMQVSVEESNGMLLIKKVAAETNNFVKKEDVQTSLTIDPLHAQLQATGKFYFSEAMYPNNSNGTPNTNYTGTPSKLMYSESRVVLQALSIPLKLRPKISNARYKDSLPTQVETGFNAGFATGIKKTWSTFKADPNVLGLNTTKISATTGIFFNIGGTDVRRLTTNYTIPVDRKEPFLSHGFFLMLGVNNINLGYAVGTDRLLSKNKETWVYQNKLWHGIIVALDIIK